MKPKVEKYVKQEGRWYPVSGWTIDMRGPGHKSQREVRESVAQRAEMTGVKITVKFE